MKVAVIGAGAMGSLFGGSLASVVDEVCLYSTNTAYVEAVNKNGLIMTQGDLKNVVKARATNNPKEIGEADVAIIYVKYSGTRKAIQDAMVSCIGKKTLVVTLQNGIGNVDIIKEYVPEGQIVYGFSTFTSDVKGPGHIEMTTSGKVETCMWPLDGVVSPKLARLENLMNQVNLMAKIAPDVEERIWRKLLVNACENTLCAILKVNVTDLMINTPESFEIAKQVIFEVSDVARAKGLNISRDAALRHVMNVTCAVPGHVPSMVFDVLKKKKTEIGSINEAIVKEGKRLGVPTPMVETIALLIRAIEANYERTVNH
ncbi:ketopantoate reductase family protein [Desulfitobacterium chlororespirans]|uniref:2-dehydropantoate 2-reductase n=1 Tax=Desulfitobacterium chlororespirans DSM 11544 TaxID=1121395 RepID=A0A1M7T4W0_9FIRM|nr:2-dehydropantoate 2-reductase [Desulfitobacterium chlororespirans]SHN65780.1 ketopantoate reductase [Desulfitobacterium chlororespirans DSM 11544]